MNCDEPSEFEDVNEASDEITSAGCRDSRVFAETNSLPLSCPGGAFIGRGGVDVYYTISIRGVRSDLSFRCAS